MIASNFPQANIIFGPPEGMHENQVAKIPAYCGKVGGGSCDGLTLVVTAWRPTVQELVDLNAGTPIFLTFVGGLPPHFVSTRFEQAINPA